MKVDIRRHELLGVISELSGSLSRLTRNTMYYEQEQIPSSGISTAELKKAVARLSELVLKLDQ